MILTNGVECTNGTAFDLVPDGPFTNDMRNMEANENIECVFNNDRILPQESDISVNNFVDNQTRKLKCWSTNADSLCNKIDELKATVSSNSPDVITVTEICPKNIRDVNIIATAIQIPGYDLFTNNMKKTGIAIYVIKDLHANMEEGLEDELVEENLWVSVELCGRDKLLIGCIYRSPNSTEENNDFCTRIREDQNPSLIDLVLVNEDDMVHNVASEPPLGLSDHVLVAFDFMCYYGLEDIEKARYVRGDYETMEEQIKGVNWEEVLYGKDVNGIWEVMCDKITDAVERNVPKMKTNMSKKSKPIWMTYKAQKAVKAKYNSWKKYTRSKQHYDFEDFKRKRNQATREVRRARMMFERKLARNLKTDVKTFWRYVNNGMKVRVPVGDLEREDGTVATTDTEKAEVLNQFFTSVLP